MAHFKTITEKEACQLIGRLEFGEYLQEDIGKFLVPMAEGTFTAIDNTEDDYWIEHFNTRFGAVRWLLETDKEV